MRKPALCICENKDAVQLHGNRYSLVCVGPGRKPRRPVFSHRGSNALTSSTSPSLQMTPVIVGSDDTLAADFEDFPKLFFNIFCHDVVVLCISVTCMYEKRLFLNQEVQHSGIVCDQFAFSCPLTTQLSDTVLILFSILLIWVPVLYCFALSR